MKTKSKSNTMVKTIKCPVVIEEPDKSQRIVKHKALRQIARECRYLGTRALEYYIGMTAFPDSRIGLKDNETKKHDTTRCYRIIQEQNSFVPANVIANLTGMVAAKAYRNGIKDARAGRKSFPTFTSEFIPIPCQGTVIKPCDNDDQYLVYPNGFGGKWLSKDLIKASFNGKAKGVKTLPTVDNPKLVIKTIFNWKHTSARATMNKILSDEYKLCDSKLKFDGKNLWFCISYKFVKSDTCLDPDITVGVDLGYNVPFVCALNNSPKRLYSSYKGHDIAAKKAGFRAVRRRKMSRQGSQSKSVKWHDLTAKEDRWTHTLYHNMTRQVINFALLNNAGTIKIEDLSGLRKKQMEKGDKKDKKKKEFERIIWLPSKFKELLTYKCEEQGISLIAVDPRNTSRRCHKCGHIDKDNRKTQADFACLKCGYTCNADYNAAVNISTLIEGQSYGLASHQTDD